MNRIIVIGCGGSGKSTLAIELGKRLALPVHHLDRIFWKPGWVSISREALAASVETLVVAPQWIIDGNYSSSMDIRLAACDMVIFLDLPRLTCLWNVLKRRVMYQGRTRPDMSEGCAEQIDAEFLKWIWNFRRNKRPEIMAKLSLLGSDKTLVILQSHRQVERFLSSL